MPESESKTTQDRETIIADGQIVKNALCYSYGEKEYQWSDDARLVLSALDRIISQNTQQTKTTKWTAVHWILYPILVPVCFLGFVTGIL